MEANPKIISPDPNSSPSAKPASASTKMTRLRETLSKSDEIEVNVFECIESCYASTKHIYRSLLSIISNAVRPASTHLAIIANLTDRVIFLLLNTLGPEGHCSRSDKLTQQQQSLFGLIRFAFVFLSIL